MPSKELLDAVNGYVENIKAYGLSEDALKALTMAAETSMKAENDVNYALSLCKGIKRYTNDFIKKESGVDFNHLEEYMMSHDDHYSIIDLYYRILLLEAPYLLDSYCLYIEKNRPKSERFYEPRRNTLLRVVNKLQALENDQLDELFVHQPPRTGKTGIMTDYCAWHCSRDTEKSNLYATYKESLGGAFLDGVIEIIQDPTYCHYDVFPDCPIVATDAKNHKMDLKRKKKYKSLSGKGLESGLNGEYDATGVLVIDDILEGIQDVLNGETLRRKQIVFDNNLMSRAKEQCKIIYNGTIWSLHDIFSDRLAFLQNNPQAKRIRWDVLKLPALDPETDESNFNYAYGVGFSTEYYQTKRSKFEENDDMASWFAQYQQEPIERDGAVFNPEHMNFYNGVLPSEEPVRICGACDVALGGADFLAFPIAYVYSNGDVYIDDVVFDNSEKDITQPQVIDAIIANNLGSVFFEANQGGELYADEVDKKLREKGIKVNIQSRYAPTNKRKEQRIWDKAPEIREFYFRDDGCRSSQYRKFMQNLFSFTINGKNQHDDAPDSLATLAQFISGTWASAKVEAVKNPFTYL